MTKTLLAELKSLELKKIHILYKKYWKGNDLMYVYWRLVLLLFDSRLSNKIEI